MNIERRSSFSRPSGLDLIEDELTALGAVGEISFASPNEGQKIASPFIARDRIYVGPRVSRRVHLVTPTRTVTIFRQRANSGRTRAQNS